jgi:hypothetical protein
MVPLRLISIQIINDFIKKHSLLQQLTTNQPAPDFIGTSTYLVKFGISKQSTSWVIVDVPIASQSLDGF